MTGFLIRQAVTSLHPQYDLATVAAPRTSLDPVRLDLETPATVGQSVLSIAQGIEDVGVKATEVLARSLDVRIWLTRSQRQYQSSRGRKTVA
jgi:hypothetical protein